jgi:isoquinoline 1-oxidoreductase beta subunit
LLADGTTTVFVPNSELGQGVSTGLPTLIAEELDVPMDSVRLRFANANPKYYYAGEDSMWTGGSVSMQRAWEPLRKAGASARAVLVSAAAKRWRVAPHRCTTSDGVVFGPSGESAAYVELLADASTLPVPKRVSLKDPKHYKLIGGASRRLDAPAKVDGSAVFGIDVRVPDMLYASIQRPPTFAGKVVSFDDREARRVSGVVDVIRIWSGVAVVATNTWAAFEGRKKLNVTYDDGPDAMMSTETLVTRSRKLLADPAAAIVRFSNASSQHQRARTTIEAVYTGPFLAHTTMEPMNATADVRADRVDVWASTQDPTNAQALAARVTGLPPEKCTVHVPYVGGAFGRRYINDFVLDALETSKAVGKPVKVTWMREDDIQHDWYRPMSVTRIKGALNADNRVVDLAMTVVEEAVHQYVRLHWYGGRARRTERLTAAEREDFIYDIPNVTSSGVDYQQGVPISWWRAPGANWNTFVTESFIDELAHAAGEDPVEFRLQMLRSRPRLARTLRAAAERVWGKTKHGTYQGVALVNWDPTVGAIIADVSVNGDSVKLHRVTAVVDCGRVVNPDIVVAQMQGGIMMGWSAAKAEKITIEKGRAVQANFDTYPVARMADAPESIDVYCIPSDAPPSGIGEVGTPAIAPAITNAIFAATGKRIRTLPISALA